MVASQAFLDATRSRTSTWDRLPTPVHFDQHSPSLLLSPPLSRASSPRPSPLSISTDSSTGSISPLPSPVARQVGKKTSAFFSSPFERTPSPPRRSSTPDPAAKERVQSELERSQTANSSFFFAKGAATPTPPPSIHSSADDADGLASKRLPPLARFFPSRATERDEDSLDAPNDFKRDFVTLDESNTFYGSPPDIAVKTEVNASYGEPFSDLVPSDSPTPKVEAQDPIQVYHDPTSADTVAVEPVEGSIVGNDVPLILMRELGKGSFSRVWLALDMDHKLEKHSGVARLRSQSIARKKRDSIVQGLKPQMSSGAALSRSQSIFLAQRHGEGATSAADDDDDHNGSGDGGQLVAVKMMDRAMCDVNDRTRISFVREVEVLRHISHSSIVSYLHSFSTLTHHCLVLEALLGGELFELLDQDDNHGRMTEPLLRRIFGELCQAVGWMHGVGLVHRDLKLENILLTANPFLTSPINLAALPSPLVKLTDFGLARFIDPASPALSTRCGSESYAAPEIVTGKTYDGRQTDAWACGIVLYALTTRALPFDRAGGERDTRRAYLMRVAQGDYAWPEPQARLATKELKSVVARLLIRDPSKRARVVEIWDEEWMRGEGAPTPPLSRAGSANAAEATGWLLGKDIPSVAKQDL